MVYIKNTKEVIKMNVYMSKDTTGYENPILAKHIKNMISLIDFDGYLSYYRASVNEDFIIESIDDAWILFEFLAYLSEGINMQDYLNIKNITVFKSILLCIKYNIDSSQILEAFHSDSEEFVEAYCMEAINDIYHMNSGYDDIVFEFCSSSRISLLIGFAKLFNDSEKNDVRNLLKTSSNVWFFNEVSQILNIEIKTLNDAISAGKIGGFAELCSEFNRTVVSFTILNDYFMGIHASYTESILINFPVLSLNE